MTQMVEIYKSILGIRAFRKTTNLAVYKMTTRCHCCLLSQADCIRLAEMKDG